MGFQDDLLGMLGEMLDRAGARGAEESEQKILLVYDHCARLQDYVVVARRDERQVPRGLNDK